MQVVEHAASFWKRHATEPQARRELQTAFGAFTHSPFSGLNQRRLRLVTERARQLLLRPSRILDLGCGGGILTQAMASLGHRALGLESNAAALHWAKRFAVEYRLPAAFARGDAQNLESSFALIEDTLGGKPGLVFLGYALHHFSDPEAVLNVLHAWLPTGAALLINEDNPESRLFRIQARLTGLLHRHSTTPGRRSFAGWNTLLSQTGFIPDVAPEGVDPWARWEQWVTPTAAERWSLVWSARKS